MNDAELVAWAIQEIRELDELARSYIPEYLPLQSSDMDALQRLGELQERLAEEEE